VLGWGGPRTTVKKNQKEVGKRGRSLGWNLVFLGGGGVKSDNTTTRHQKRQRRPLFIAGMGREARCQEKMRTDTLGMENRKADGVGGEELNQASKKKGADSI